MLRRTRSVLIKRKHRDDACFTTYLMKHGVSVQKDQEIRIADVNAQLKRTMQIIDSIGPNDMLSSHSQEPGDLVYDVQL